jgi:hypothetical protein
MVGKPLQNFEIGVRSAEAVLLEPRRGDEWVEVEMLLLLLPAVLVRTTVVTGLGRGQGVRMAWPQP